MPWPATWPRPTILHRARKAGFGGTDYDDGLTRLRLKQAFGRLIRRSSDRGVFVLLDRAFPSRLAGAFPEGVEVRRAGLAEAVLQLRADFLSPACVLDDFWQERQDAATGQKGQNAYALAV